MGSVNNRLQPGTGPLPSFPGPQKADPAESNKGLTQAEFEARFKGAPGLQAPNWHLDLIGLAAGSSATSVAFSEAEPAVLNPTSHKVKPGESLSSIAKTYFDDPNYYMEIFQANKSSNFSHPNAPLRVGQELKLPQHLFPKPETTVPKAESALSAYRKENPLSFLTLAPTQPRYLMPQDASQMQTVFPLKPGQSPFQMSPAEIEQLKVELQVHEDRAPVEGAKQVEHVDAVKTNKVFDLHSMTAATMPKQLGPWATKVAELLHENQATITLPSNKGPVTVDAPYLRQLAEQLKQPKGYENLKKQFGDQGTAFFNSLWAIDDVVNDLRNDPYYEEKKSIPKTVDLAAVADKFNLTNDKVPYLNGVASHKHRQVPVLLEINPAELTNHSAKGKNAEQMIADLAGCFNRKGVLTKPEQFEEKVYGILQDASARRLLVKKFGLDSDANLKALIPAITSESGTAKHQQDYDSYFAVGSVMLNRTLGRNLKKYAAAQAAGTPPEKVKPVTVRDIVFEEGQFEITWRKLPGSNGSFYDYHASLNNTYLAGKLKEGNSSHALDLAYETSQDLLSGMNRLSAEVNGNRQKGVGRSTAEIFYFNQSRSHDYSKDSTQNSAVELIDKNNTHVFFKAWDEISYFR